jgi:quercetin dioxygenase-like cupin family protein
MNRRYPLELPPLLREAGATDAPRLAEALSALVPPVKAPPQLLRERLLATVARPCLRYAPLFGKLSELFDLDDTALAALCERAAAPTAWSASPIVGMRLMHLQGGPRVAGADNGLVRLAAGTRFPRHRHLGLERVLVMEGGYRDEQDGRLYLPGDWHEMQPGTSHAYTALPDHQLLIAVSVQGGVDIDGFGTLSPSAG